VADEHLSFSDYGELVGVISDLCANGRTGSLFIVSETNCFARVVIAAGNIIYLEYRLKKGVDAIPLFLEIQHGSIDYKDGKVISHKASPLPSTPDLLAQLGGEMAPAVSPSKSAAAAETPVAVDAFKIIENELIDVLGPMASLIWEEHLDRAGGPEADVDIGQLISRVSSEIDDPDKAAQFREHIRGMLAG
jgi:hypothetical protein